MNLSWRIALYCLLGGFCLRFRSGHRPLLAVVASGVITVAALTPVVRFGPRPVPALMGAISYAGSGGTGMHALGRCAVLSQYEGRVAARPDGRGNDVSHHGCRSGGACEGVEVKRNRGAARRASFGGDGNSVDIAGRPFLCCLLPDLRHDRISILHQTVLPPCRGTSSSLGSWFWVYQWGRGTLMTLAVLPVIYTLRLRRWHAALAVGVLVWIVGGGAALFGPESDDGSGATLRSHRGDHDTKRLAGYYSGAAAAAAKGSRVASEGTNSTCTL